MRQTDAGQVGQGETNQGQQSQGQADEGQADEGLADGRQVDRGQTGAGQVHNDASMEVGPGAGSRRRVTRASARQVALLQDMDASGVCHLLQQNQGVAAVVDIAAPTPPSVPPSRIPSARAPLLLSLPS